MREQAVAWSQLLQQQNRHHHHQQQQQQQQQQPTFVASSCGSNTAAISNCMRANGPNLGCTRPLASFSSCTAITARLNLQAA
jgi:hypothetical protein